MKKIKRETKQRKILKGSKGITLIALVITIIVLLILAAISIATLTGDNGILTKAQEASDRTKEAAVREQIEVEAMGSFDSNGKFNRETFKQRIQDIGGKVLDENDDEIKVELDGYESLVDAKTGKIKSLVVTGTEQGGGEEEEVAFTKEFGKIDIIWVNTDTENTKRDTPLEPVLNENNKMKKVYWEDDGTEKKEDDSDFDNSKWYNYVAGDNSTDSMNSHWANAINTTEGGDSYFVWIPRFAYKITYLTEDGQVAGYCDGRGIIDTKGELVYEGEGPKGGIETVDYNGFKYIVHPAFVDNVSNGGWTSDLPGFWVGKYESGTNGSSKIKIVPGVQSWRSINIGTMYTNAKDYDTNKKSHLMKNSEWGAVAYLTHSQYGRNGHEITINSNDSYYTGGGQNSAYKTNTDQSSTGNIYGIYDLSGGAWEYVAAFNDTDSNGYETTNGNSFAGTNKNSDEYATKYSSSSSTPSYTSYIPGDATYEVYTGSSNRAWFDDYSGFVSSEYPFFRRGGLFSKPDDVGVFFASWAGGNDNNNKSFRVILAGV